jgi:hypothetical protein
MSDTHRDTKLCYSGLSIWPGRWLQSFTLKARAMNACVSGKRRLSGKGGDLVSCDIVQVICGGKLVRKVLSSKSSDGQAVTAAGFQKVKGRLYPSRNSHASLNDGDTF